MLNRLTLFLLLKELYDDNIKTIFIFITNSPISSSSKIFSFSGTFIVPIEKKSFRYYWLSSKFGWLVFIWYCNMLVIKFRLNLVFIILILVIKIKLITKTLFKNFYLILNDITKFLKTL